jgi:hypothetical protein
MMIENITGIEKSSFSKCSSVLNPHWNKRKSQRSLRCILFCHPPFSHNDPTEIIHIYAKHPALNKRERR